MSDTSPDSASEGGRALIIRSARAADSYAILSINRDGVPGVGALAPPDVAFYHDRSTLFRVAEERGQVVAYVVIFDSRAAYDGEEYLWFRNRYDAFLYIDQVAVAREARGRGVAAALYDDVEKAARASATPTLVCEVNLEPDNPPSHRFHRRRGFLEVGRLRSGDGRLVSLLEKRLRDPG